MSSPFSRLSFLWSYGLLFLVVAGLYGQSLGFGYVWDDGTLFVENTLLREGVWSWGVVARPILPEAPYFRPLVLATWMAEMALFELSPLYSHAINIVLHGINTSLVYVIATRVLGTRHGERLAALTAALIFTVHPCLIEGVAWVSGRFDVLATALLLSGCVIAMAPPTVVRSACVGALAFGSMLSKEIGLLFVPILVLLVMARSPDRKLRALLMELWPYLAAYTIASLLYFHLRSQALGFTTYSGFGVSQLLESLLNYNVWLRRLSFYTFMSIAPFSSISPLHDMQMELFSYRQYFVALATAVFMALIVICFALKRRRWAILCMGFYFGIFPVLGIFSINISGTIGAERFLYLPIVMLALGIAAFLLTAYEKYSQQRIVVVAGGTLVCGWFLLATFVTCTVVPMWSSGAQLWGWQYHLNPENRLVRLYYFNELSNSQIFNLQETFKQEIEKIKNINNGSLPMEAQITYANFLLRSNDAEALPYLEGLIINMGQGGATGVRLHETIYSGVLANYAQALMVFQGDLVSAREAMEQAKVATPRGSEFQIIHQMIALEYIAGNTKIAADLYNKNIATLQAAGINKMHYSMQAIVKETCKSKKWSDCEKYALNFVDYIKNNSSIIGKK